MKIGHARLLGNGQQVARHVRVRAEQQIAHGVRMLMHCARQVLEL